MNAVVEQPKTEEKIVLRQTHAGRFKIGGHYTQDWEVVVEHGTKLEDVLKPEFFAHVAQQLRAFSKIKVLSDDGSFYAELLVRSAAKTWARCVVLNHVDYTEAAAAAAGDSPADYAGVNFGGPHHKWRVVRTVDKEVLSKGHEDEAAARAWLADHLKTVVR